MTTVRQVLAVKGSHVHTIHPKECVFDALKRMDEEDVGSLVVMDGECLVGILTERHYARKVALKGKTSLATPVSDIMERDVVVSRPDLTIEECIAVMSACKKRHLPVVQGDRLIGIVSLGDMMSSMIGDQKFAIDQMVQYICS